MKIKHRKIDDVDANRKLKNSILRTKHRKTETNCIKGDHKVQITCKQTEDHVEQLNHKTRKDCGDDGVKKKKVGDNTNGD